MPALCCLLAGTSCVRDGGRCGFGIHNGGICVFGETTDRLRPGGAVWRHRGSGAGSAHRPTQPPAACESADLSGHWRRTGRGTVRRILRRYSAAGAGTGLLHKDAVQSRLWRCAIDTAAGHIPRAGLRASDWLDPQRKSPDDALQVCDGHRRDRRRPATT